MADYSGHHGEDRVSTVEAEGNGGGDGRRNGGRLPGAARGKRLRPRSYSLAIYMVGVVGVLQIIAVLSVFYLRSVVVKIDTVAPPLVQASTGPGLPIRPILQLGEPLAPGQAVPVRPLRPLGLAPAAGQPAPAGARDSVVRLKPPDRLPTPEAKPSVAINQQQLQQLNTEAEALIKRGEFNLAAGVLAKAELIDPDHPMTVRQQAQVAEGRKQLEQARRYWQKLFDMGSRVGDDYEMAKEKLPAIDLALKRAGRPMPTPAPVATMTAPVSAPQVAVAKPVAIGAIEKALPIGGGSNRFTLRVEVQRAEAAVDSDISKLSLVLWFYELRADGSIKPSIARIKTSFEGDQGMWRSSGKGYLVADYDLPQDAALAEGRQYYGYLVRVSYDGQLYDQRAEPESLLQFFQPMGGAGR
jgi:hypothetical protein